MNVITEDVKRRQSVVSLREDQIQVLVEEDLDVYTRSLSQTQFEALVVLLANRKRMTVKAIQRTIEYSYIFEFLEDIKDELDAELERRGIGIPGEQRRNHLINDRKEVNNVEKKKEILDRILLEKVIKDRLLRREIEVFLGVQSKSKSFFGGDSTGFKNFMLTNDGYGSPERKRVGVISEINKNSSLKVPSYNTIANALEELRLNGYLEYTSAKTMKKNAERIRTRANGVWQVSDIFFGAWNRRRVAVLSDYEKKSSHETNGNTAVLKDFVRIYSARLLDIYLIKVSERIEIARSSSTYLAHQAMVAEVFRD